MEDNYDAAQLPRSHPCNLKISEIAVNCICSAALGPKPWPTMAIVAIKYSSAHLALQNSRVVVQILLAVVHWSALVTLHNN